MYPANEEDYKYNTLASYGDEIRPVRKRGFSTAKKSFQTMQNQSSIVSSSLGTQYDPKKPYKKQQLRPMSAPRYGRSVQQKRTQQIKDQFIQDAQAMQE